MEIVVRAPLLSISGYGHHSRQVFEALMSIPDSNISTQVVQWGNTSWIIDANQESGIAGEIMKRSTDRQSGFDVSFQVQLPDEWSNTLAKINIGITAAVETDRCNPAWAEKCNLMDAVIVPSNFTKGVLQKSGKIEKPIFVIPEWFIPEIESSDFVTEIPTRTKFNFLIVSQLTSQDPNYDRKNISNTLKWIFETFKEDNDVGIILKTNSGRGTTIDRSITEQFLNQIVSTNRKNSKVPIYFVHGCMTNEEVSGIYRNNTVKALVSLTRGEGFGLPLLEAAAAGVPVIATDWSAHTEFLDLGKWIKIDSDLIEIPEERADGRIFVKGTRWANPSEESFKKKIKKFKESNEIPRQWAKDLSIKCTKDFSKNSILKRYQDIFQEILKNV